MAIRFFLMLIIVSVSLGGLFYWKIEQNKAQQAAQAQQQMPPFTVETDFARAETWQVALRAIGSLEAINGIELKTETEGRVSELMLKSGIEVQKGQVLLKLDDREERAELAALQAQLKLARLDYQRDQELVKQNSISKASLDKSRAQLEKSEADIARIQAVIAKKTLYAPFDGHVGIRNVDIGEYIKDGQAITTLQSVDPIYVNFLLPEKDLPHLEIGQTVEVYLDAWPKQVFQAKLNAIDAQINPNSRNIVAQALLPNPDHHFVPGMFAKVRVLLAQQTPVVSVPETAVAYSLYGNSVFVVESGGDGDKPVLQVKRRYVTIGRSQNGRVAITEGVQDGEQVVSAGGLKLRDGAKVSIKTPEQDQPSRTL